MMVLPPPVVAFIMEPLFCEQPILVHQAKVLLLTPQSCYLLIKKKLERLVPTCCIGFRNKDIPNWVFWRGEVSLYLVPAQRGSAVTDLICNHPTTTMGCLSSPGWSGCMVISESQT